MFQSLDFVEQVQTFNKHLSVLFFSTSDEILYPADIIYGDYKTENIDHGVVLCPSRVGGLYTTDCYKEEFSDETELYLAVCDLRDNLTMSDYFKDSIKGFIDINQHPFPLEHFQGVYFDEGRFRWETAFNQDYFNARIHDKDFESEGIHNVYDIYQNTAHVHEDLTNFASYMKSVVRNLKRPLLDVIEEAEGKAEKETKGVQKIREEEVR